MVALEVSLTPSSLAEEVGILSAAGEPPPRSPRLRANNLFLTWGTPAPFSLSVFEGHGKPSPQALGWPSPNPSRLREGS